MDFGIKKCDICNARFTENVTLKAHMKSVHLMFSLNLPSQMSHWYGFFFSWTDVIWAFKGQRSYYISSWIKKNVIFAMQDLQKTLLWKLIWNKLISINLASQISHYVKYLILFSKTDFIWAFKVVTLSENLASQILH